MNIDTTNENQDIKELSINELLQTGRYFIPIYQRNYAWGEQEIEQLIQDIVDAVTYRKNTNYFIGSLIVYSRSYNHFETIDGQQRHTTICILVSVLKNVYSADIEGISEINLRFDSRPKSDYTLSRLFHQIEISDVQTEEINIRSAYGIIDRILSRIDIQISSFTSYLMKHVKILRVSVPSDTDLNHYFEIMNNRGEQLEKHEILKARLMKNLKTDYARIAFSKIWDACSEMNRYVQLGIESEARTNVFGSNWNSVPDDFSLLCEALKGTVQKIKKRTLADLISKPVLKSDGKLNYQNEKSSFNAIITFPNFLLHVLRLLTKKDIPLDDKRLLDSFDEYLPEDNTHSVWFLMGLLKTRMIFDRYIIKRENDREWNLQTLKTYGGKKKSFSYINSFDNENLNKQIIMLLSMFHVSFPAQIYKHWLNATLNYLFESHSQHISGKSFLAFLERLNDHFFWGRYGDFNNNDPIDYFQLTYEPPELPNKFDPSHLNQGTNIQNFIFNRLDYLLWKRLERGEIFKGVNMEYIQKHRKEFSFTFRTSVEHYYPRNPLSDIKMIESDALPNGVDTFGNLCLISRSNNSKLSNYLPTAKKEHYEKATIAESLKQVFMMSYKNWGPHNIEIIKEHEKMMLNILCDQ